MNELCRRMCTLRFDSSTELYHHGILGMHWGIRRFQPYAHGGYIPDSTGGKLVGLAARIFSSNNRGASAKSISQTVSDFTRNTATIARKRVRDIGTSAKERFDAWNAIDTSKRTKKIAELQREIDWNRAMARSYEQRQNAQLVRSRLTGDSTASSIFDALTSIRETNFAKARMAQRELSSYIEKSPSARTKTELISQKMKGLISAGQTPVSDIPKMIQRSKQLKRASAYDQLIANRDIGHLIRRAASLERSQDILPTGVLAKIAYELTSGGGRTSQEYLDAFAYETNRRSKFGFSDSKESLARAHGLSKKGAMYSIFSSRA